MVKKRVVGAVVVWMLLVGGSKEANKRFKCKSCSLLFTRTNKSVSDKNRFIWFEKWVMGKQIISQISHESGYSVRTLKNYFHTYLEKAPIWNVYPSEKVNLLIDGTYFTRNLCLVLYRDNSIKFTQLYRLSDGENYEEIKEDLANLLALGVQIESITCDGHRAILKAISPFTGDYPQNTEKTLSNGIYSSRTNEFYKPCEIPVMELKKGSRSSPSLLYICKSYCWQGALQQSLLPLRIYARK